MKDIMLNAFENQAYACINICTLTLATISEFRVKNIKYVLIFNIIILGLKRLLTCGIRSANCPD